MANLGVILLYMTVAAVQAKLMSIFTVTDNAADVKEAMTDDTLGGIPNVLNARSVHEY